LISAIPLRKERGIYAASLPDCNKTLENFEGSVLRTVKRRERRAPSISNPSSSGHSRKLVVSPWRICCDNALLVAKHGNFIRHF
jgi:hypothetical protein